MGAAPIGRLTVDQYLEIERTAESPSEYHDGEIFPVESASVPHGRLGTNVARRFSERLDGGSCEALSQVKVRVAPTKFLVPDQTVICGSPQYGDKYQETITNPKVIIEILSPNTSGYDHGDKFALYRQLASIEEYVLIAQDRPSVEVFRKTAEGRWMLTIYEGLEANAQVESLGIAIPLAELYAGFSFEPGAAVLAV